ncbi:MAG TPA: PfkB family carbohydrate kinase, partial [Acidobacteriota bacterium]|nr:PfkB family carbohydrate kinase [Acidobacteriota bacterium]
GPKQVVITLGAKGSIGLDRQEIVRQEAFKVKAVDTTGAGDVYHGAYIYGILQGWELRECMRFASAAAALKCKEMGAQSGVPDLEAIRSYMASLG